MALAGRCLAAIFSRSIPCKPVYLARLARHAGPPKVKHNLGAAQAKLEIETRGIATCWANNEPSTVPSPALPSPAGLPGRPDPAGGTGITKFLAWSNDRGTVPAAQQLSFRPEVVRQWALPSKQFETTLQEGGGGLSAMSRAQITLRERAAPMMLL